MTAMRFGSRLPVEALYEGVSIVPSTGKQPARAHESPLKKRGKAGEGEGRDRTGATWLAETVSLARSKDTREARGKEGTRGRN